MLLRRNNTKKSSYVIIDWVGNERDGGKTNQHLTQRIHFVSDYTEPRRVKVVMEISTCISISVIAHNVEY